MVVTLARPVPQLKVPTPGEVPTPVVPEPSIVPNPEPDPDRDVPIDPPSAPQTL